jgi:hypothetical protein
MMQAPKDQVLFFTLFFSICFGLTLIVWTALPVHHKEAEEEEEKKAAITTPEGMVKNAQQVLSRAEAALAQAEASLASDKDGKKKAPKRPAPKTDDAPKTDPAPKSDRVDKPGAPVAATK